jgi:DNA-binding CsgD family transcriptional regulator
MTSDTLIDRGLFDELTAAPHADYLCMALCTRVLDGTADRGAGLMTVTTRGHWEMVGGFLDFFDAAKALDGQRATDTPGLMSAVAHQWSETEAADPPWQPEGVPTDTHLTVIGLSHPTYGVLALGSRAPLAFSPAAKKLLRGAVEMWLDKNRGGRISGIPPTQVTSANSEVMFTKRQFEVLTLLAEGMTNTDIGKALSISASLAKQEVAFLSHALQAKNRLDVVIRAQRRGILGVDRH